MGTAHAGRPHGENERAAGAISTAGSDLSGHGRVARDRGDGARDDHPAGPVSGTEPPRVFAIAPRQREIFRQLALGLTYAEVGVRLQIKSSTVRRQVGTAFTRLRASGHEIQNTIDVFRLLGWLTVPPR
jgi:DNA-binding CsgD family transcriptional regulator